MGRVQLTSTRGTWRRDEWGLPASPSPATAAFFSAPPEGLLARISQHSPPPTLTSLHDTWYYTHNFLHRDPQPPSFLPPSHPPYIPSQVMSAANAIMSHLHGRPPSSLLCRSLLTATACSSESSHRGATKVYPIDVTPSSAPAGLTWAVQSAIKTPCVDELTCLSRLLPHRAKVGGVGVALRVSHGPEHWQVAHHTSCAPASALSCILRPSIEFPLPLLLPSSFSNSH